MSQQFIKRYQILKTLGQSGMTTVYRAQDPILEREVAIKLFSRSLLDYPQFQARFKHEIRSIAGLDHIAIVPIFDMGDHEGQPYFVMSYMAGGGLDQRLRQGALDPNQVIKIFDRVSGAVDSAHSQGFIHRGLKPSNILFDHNSEAHVADFGVIDLIDLDESGIIGTAAYMAPEMVGKTIPPSPSVDIYALGVTVFEMLTGRKPYPGDDPIEVILAHLNEPIPQVTSIRHDLPHTLQPVIERALAKQPEQRYRSVLKFAEDLRSAFTISTTAAEETVRAYSPRTVEEPAAPSKPGAKRKESRPLTSVFVSYSRQDWEEYVEPLVSHLKFMGIDVWVDQHLLRGGDDWLDKIDQALDASQVLILCLSPTALSSNYVKMEYRYFFNNNKRIIPVMCRDVDRLPAELQMYQYIPYEINRVAELVGTII